MEHNLQPAGNLSSYQPPTPTEEPLTILEQELDTRNKMQIALAENMGIDMMVFIQKYGKSFSDFLIENPSVLDEYKWNQESMLQQAKERILH
jgi:hypothetical protein